MKSIEIYTDGACSYNPGPGGWGAILIYKGVEKRLSGGEASTTNNQMEMLAVINALQCLKEPCEVTLYSDSAYVVNAFLQGWVDKWRANGWRRPKDPLKNVELWKQLVKLVDYHNVTFVKVKGHADNEYNNQCDALARGEVEKILGEKYE